MSASTARTKPPASAAHRAAHPSPAALSGPTLDPASLIAAAERHQRLIWGGVALIVVALFGAWGMHAFNARKLAADNVKLAHAFALLEAHVDDAHTAGKPGKVTHGNDAETGGTGAEDDAEDARPLAGQPHFATFGERNEAAHAAFAEAIPTLSSRSLRTLAEMMAANLEVELDRPSEARKRLEVLTERLSAEETLGALARMRLAYVLESQEQRQEALRALTPLTDEQRSHFADEASLMRARLLTAEGDVQLARMTLEQVRSRSSNQALAEEARIALAALNDSAESPEAYKNAVEPDPALTSPGAP